MHHTLRFIAVPLCAALMLAVPALQASPTCDVHASNACPLPTQVVTFKSDCPRASGQHACPEIHSPPPAELHCSSGQNTVVCDAWPQSDQLTYRYVWSVLNGIEPNYSSSEFSPLFIGNCTGRVGRVSVTVIAPNGHATSANYMFTCEHGQ